MPRITWGDPGTRFYENGIDRGVLYVGANPGVPWTGLISVVESPSGAEARPHYIDGVKYLNLASSEEYQATIDAYGCPLAFLSCDGTVEIHNGLYATQQPRTSFGFSYRTFIGNDIDFSEHAYKIHLVYGALASPSQRSAISNSDKTNATVLSWALSTCPPSVTGYRRTSHYAVDSRYANTGVLSTLENLLYGNESQYSSLPTPDTLISLFA